MRFAKDEEHPLMPVTVPTVDDVKEWLAIRDDRLDALERLWQQPQPGPVPPEPVGFWLSGGSEHTGIQEQLARWGTWRGRPCTTVTVYTTRGAGWPAWVSSHATSGQIAVYNDPTLDVVIQTSPFPINVNATYAGAVRGEHDIHYRAVARLLAERADRRGQPDTVCWAWEANGEYMRWGGGPNPPGQVGHYENAAQYRSAFQHAADVMHDVFPELPLCFTINGHGPSDTWDLFPGWKYVKYVGIDDYDHYPRALTKSAFDARSNAVGGIGWLAAKVETENLRRADEGDPSRVFLRVPEWGVNGNVDDFKRGFAGGDNPLYIEWMWDLFRLLFNKKILKSEFYYADPVRIYGNVDSSLLDGNPLSAAAMQRLWRL